MSTEGLPTTPEAWSSLTPEEPVVVSFGCEETTAGAARKVTMPLKAFVATLGHAGAGYMKQRELQPFLSAAGNPRWRCGVRDRPGYYRRCWLPAAAVLRCISPRSVVSSRHVP